MIKRQKLIGIVASVVLAAVGTEPARDLRPQRRGPGARRARTPVDVLVVTDTIPKGTKAEDDRAPRSGPSRCRSRWPPRAPSPTSARWPARSPAVDLLPGEQLVQSRFARRGRRRAGRRPPDALQVTVALDAVRAVGGQVRGGRHRRRAGVLRRPGDHPPDPAQGAGHRRAHRGGRRRDQQGRRPPVPPATCW